MKVGVMIFGIWILSLIQSFTLELQAGFTAENFRVNSQRSVFLYHYASRFDPNPDGPRVPVGSR